MPRWEFLVLEFWAKTGGMDKREGVFPGEFGMAYYAMLRYDIPPYFQAWFWRDGIWEAKKRHICMDVIFSHTILTVLVPVCHERQTDIDITISKFIHEKGKRDDLI